MSRIMKLTSPLRGEQRQKALDQILKTIGGSGRTTSLICLARNPVRLEMTPLFYGLFTSRRTQLEGPGVDAALLAVGPGTERFNKFEDGGLNHFLGNKNKKRAFYLALQAIRVDVELRPEMYSVRRLYRVGK